MADNRYYRVAGHLFSIEAETEVFDTILNYEPFRVDNAEESELLFRVVLSSEVFPDVTMKHIFTDTSDEDMPRIEVYRTGDEDDADWVICVSMLKESPICCRMIASHDFSKAELYVESFHQNFAINNAAMLLFAFASAPYRTLEMHAAVVVKEGMGYLFLGKSGTGKSTHARQWLKAFPDSRLLNDDNPILRVEEEEMMCDGQLVKKDVVRVYGSPWSGKTPCYINENAPVGGIVKLSQAPENVIRSIRMPEAYAYLLSSASGMKIQSSMMDAIYTAIVGVLNNVPVMQMDCLPNEDADMVCYKGVNSQIKR